MVAKKSSRSRRLNNDDGDSKPNEAKDKGDFRAGKPDCGRLVRAGGDFEQLGDEEIARADGLEINV